MTKLLEQMTKMKLTVAILVVEKPVVVHPASALRLVFPKLHGYYKARQLKFVFFR